MFTKLYRRVATERFNLACRGILRTPPLRYRAAPVRVVSMVRTEHLRMYLVAIKAFYRHISGGDIVIMDDGSLTAADRILLAEHLPGMNYVRIDAIRTGECPRGSCWERLLHILDLSRDAYVVQLDSDVLTVDPIPEVVAAIACNAAFTLGSGPEFGMVDLDAAAMAVTGWDESATQVLAEKALPDLPVGLERRYVRGSAGFAGFAKGGSSRAAAEAFSAAMQQRMGSRWTAWGTEQVASNYLVANSPGGQVLPWPKYCCFYPSVRPEEAALLHFLGTWRFDQGVYATKARQVIRTLGRAH